MRKWVQAMGGVRALVILALTVAVASVPVQSVADTIAPATTVHGLASAGEGEGQDVQHTESASPLCASEERAGSQNRVILDMPEDALPRVRTRGILDMPEDALQLQAIEERDLNEWMHVYSLALGGKDSVQLLSAPRHEEARADDDDDDAVERIRRRRRRGLALQALARHAEQPHSCALLLRHGFLTKLLRLVSPSKASSALAAGGELTGEENRDILYTIVKMVHHHGDPSLPSCPRQYVAAIEDFLIASYHTDRDEDALEKLEAKQNRQQQLQTRSGQSPEVSLDRQVSEGSEGHNHHKAQQRSKRRYRGIPPIRSLLSNDELIEPFKHMMEVAGERCKHACRVPRGSADRRHHRPPM
jgi:hypothetical protein